ncbi:MAG: hypothetical protein H6Q76_1469, partial [Firmicutes bacterium]|nr:hypothetical protein [Bacillota bacterium]
KWLDAALKSGNIDNPKELYDFIEIDDGGDGDIWGWVINRQAVLFSDGGNLYCSERGEDAGTAGYVIPEYHFHFQPDSDNVDMETFRLDLDRSKEPHFNTSEQRSAVNDHLPTGETPFDFSNFNCRLALLMANVNVRTKIYPLDDTGQAYYEPVLSNKKDG